MNRDRYRRLCVVVPDGNSNKARVYVEDTGEQIEGVETVIFRLSANPTKTRVRVDLCASLFTFCSGEDARRKKIEMDRKWAQIQNQQNMERLGISRIH